MQGPLSVPPPPPPMEKVATTNKAKKGGGIMHFIRVALFMVKARPHHKSPGIVQSAGKEGMWKSLLILMRPLHPLSCTSFSSPPSPTPDPLPCDSFHDVVLPPPSPSSNPRDTDSMSRYASAEDLRALDETEGSDAKGEEGGDEGIDAKAEEFITKFYEQMRLQRCDSKN